MADGLNKTFKRNPAVFIQANDLVVSPQGYGSTKIAGGATSIDLVMIDKKIVPNVVRLESYAAREHTAGAEAISAYFLPAINDDTNTLAIGDACPYSFTADLSGCLFAAYGANRNQLTVEHVNVRTSSAKVAIGPRAGAIMNGGYAICFIISPVPVVAANGATVVNYNTGGVVVGERHNNSWRFHYRVDGNKVATF